MIRTTSLSSLIILLGGLLAGGGGFAPRLPAAVQAAEQATPPAQASTPAPKPAQKRAPKPAGSPAAGQNKPPVARPATPAPAAPVDVETAAWKLLTEGAASPKYPTRSDAISALEALGADHRAAGMIEQALSDKESIIRVQAASSLGEIKDHSTIPGLRVALDDKAPEVSFAAAQALWAMGDRSGRDNLYEILEGSRKGRPGMIQANINKAKADMHDPKAMVLIGINAASSALLGPGVLGVSAIEEFAIDKSAPVKALCAKLLSEDDTPDTVAELEQALADKNWVIRAAAARALASMKHPEALPLLVQMMANDKKNAARLTAAAAVIRLSKKTA